MPRKNPQKPTRRRRPPATDPEGRERQIAAAAYDLAEKQILEGTASSQIITHYLKLGSTRERLEQEKLRGENKLLVARVEQLESAKKVEELYREAMEAFTSYSGREDDLD